jgi:heptosyltransferase I
MKHNDINKIGIIKLGSIGDIIHTLPVSYILRKNFPDAKIDWIVERKSLEILTGNRYIDNIVVIDTKAWRKYPFGKTTIKAVIGLWQYFKEASYDVVFDFQGLIKSGIISYLTKAPVRVGFDPKECREKLNHVFMSLNATIAGEKAHVIQKNLNILKTIDLDVYEVEFPFTLSNGDEKPILQFFQENDLSDNDIIAAVDPSAGWITKCIELELLAKVVDYLALSKGCKVVLMWGPGEQDKALKIREKSLSNPLILCQTNLKNLAAFLKRCNLMISPDTGPMHLAAALGVKCIGIYGPSCPFKNGPFGENNLFVSRFVDCSPCYKRKCDDLKCMKTITFDDIKEKIDIAFNNL